MSEEKSVWCLNLFSHGRLIQVCFFSTREKANAAAVKLVGSLSTTVSSLNQVLTVTGHVLDQDPIDTQPPTDQA